MKNKWEEICHLMRINKASGEGLFQSKTVNLLEKLGWSRFNKEIEEKRNIKIGFENSLKPDIIVKNDENDLFVLELKKPAVKHIEKNNFQLFSYMRQLKLNVGLLINDRIHIFFENEDCRVPVEIMNIEFNEDTPEGITFLNLFSRESYNHSNLLNYCKIQLERLNAIDYLTSEDFKIRVTNFIKNDACEKFAKEVVEMALKNIEINITNTVDLTKYEKLEDWFSFETEVTNSDSEYNEIKKVKIKVPRWLNNPNQINTRILIKAMETLSIKESMSFNALVKQCVNIDNFRKNFDAMANFGTKIHGKVFEKNGDILTLWTPVKDFVRESYSAFKLSSNII